MRMKDKVLQLVTDGMQLISANAIIHNVWLRAGKMYGKFNGRAVVCTAPGIWTVTN